MKETISAIHIQVPARVRQVAKIRAVERRLTLKEYMIALILEDVARTQAATEGSENA